jgi:alpha/beta superfamily hydrolase
MISTFTNDVTQFVQGPAGQLEIAIGEPLEGDRQAIAIVCHPHPLYGGTMHNKVVTTLAKTFQLMGATVVRFNFRGVGRSVGEFDHGNGEVEDLLAVVDWLIPQHPGKEIWLGGFSFGSYVAARAATQIAATKLVTIAPPVERFPMQEIPPIYCPWVLVQGELDDVVDPVAVFEWIETRHPKPTVIRFPEAGHFFHGQLLELRTGIIDALRSA